MAGHEARVHDQPFYRNQWRSDRVYVIELTDEGLLFSIGTGYANREHWVYEVKPLGPLEPDPEVGGRNLSRLCDRAKVIRCLHEPKHVRG